MDIQHIADLVVGMHQRYDGPFRTGSKLMLQILQVDMPIGQQFHPAKRGFSSFMKMLHGMQRGMMLQGRANDMSTSQVPHRRRNGRIGAFRTTRSEEYL